MLSLVYSLLVGLAGGYTTALLARRAPFRHAVALACVGVALGIVSLVLSWGNEPLWYQLASTSVPAAGCFWAAG